MSQDQYTYGLHAVLSLIERQSKAVEHIWLLQNRKDSRMEKLIAQAKQAHIGMTFVERKKLDQMVDAPHQGVVARTRTQATLKEADLEQLLDDLTAPAFLLILDGITDPHNLGACLRSADAAGVHAVIAPKDKSAQLNATVRKVACGAAEAVPFISVTNLARTMAWLQQRGVWITGTAGEVENSVYQLDLTGPMALVMGAEGKGMRRLTREHCDQLAFLPMAGSVSSLNVSVATGVCLFEAVRQRQIKAV